MIADVKELMEMDASELHARRLNAKEKLTPMKGDNFIFPTDAGEAINDFWSMSGNFMYRHRVEPKSQTVRAARRIISCSVEVH